MDLEKLKKLQSQTRVGGKHLPRHKIPKKSLKSGGQSASSAADDKKLQSTLKKLGTQPVQGIEEVNMFKNDGEKSEVLHFSAPKVNAAVSANTFAIYGQGQNKELTELVPGILNQLGPDNLAHLRKLAESYQGGGAGAAAGLGGMGGLGGAVPGLSGEEGKKDEGEDDDDDVPDLVDSFEDASKKEENKLEEIS